jgi:Arc/MetJ family transcription regulator
VHINTYKTAYNLRRNIVRTTLNIEDALLNKARKLTGVSEKTELVKLGLESLIARESAKRLARLGGTEQGLKRIIRRRVEED